MMIPPLPQARRGPHPLAMPETPDGSGNLPPPLFEAKVLDSAGSSAQMAWQGGGHWHPPGHFEGSIPDRRVCTYCTGLIPPLEAKYPHFSLSVPCGGVCAFFLGVGGRASNFLFPFLKEVSQVAVA